MNERPTGGMGPLLQAEMIGPVLRWTAAGVFGLGLIGSLYLLAHYTGADATAGFGFRQLLMVFLSAAGGCAGGAVLLGMAGIVELQLRHVAALRRLERAAEESAAARVADVKQAFAAASAAADRNAEALADLRDVLLMDEAQRREHAVARSDHDRRRRLAEIDKLMAGGDLAAARKAVEALQVRFPQVAESAKLLERIGDEEKRRRLAEADKLADAAEQAARVERWRDAFLLASDLIAKYPDTPPADFARSGLETLRRNAEIEQRRQLEEQFKDLLARKQLAQAVSVAETLCNVYPDSPQAAALRERMPKLREQAAALRAAG